jgi:hypothetical protein
LWPFAIIVYLFIWIGRNLENLLLFLMEQRWVVDDPNYKPPKDGSQPSAVGKD